ncbi:MAG: hypothetical protein IJW99_11550 [Clostridia bacterium]|nr:hypothetical protein [Clostridia bacterium]
MNRTDDGKSNLKGNNESFQYLGSVSPEEEIRLAEERKRKSKRRTRLIAGILAGGTLMGSITVGYLKNNALISPYFSDIGKDLFATPEYKELYKEYKDYSMPDLNFTKASGSLVGFYMDHFSLTEEEANLFTSLKAAFFTKDKMYAFSVVVKGIDINGTKSKQPIYSLLEYQLNEEIVQDLIKNKDDRVAQNLMITEISKKFTPRLISELDCMPHVMFYYDGGNTSGYGMYDFEKGYLSGIAFLMADTPKLVTIYSDAAPRLTKDAQGVYQVNGDIYFCQIKEELGEVEMFFTNNSINLPRQYDNLINSGDLAK